MINVKTFLAIPILCVISFEGYANQIPTELNAEIQAEMREFKSREGFAPDGGITVIKSEKTNIPTTLKSKWTNDRLEQNKNGYVKTYSDRAKELSQLNDIVNFKYEVSKKDFDRKSSILRENLSEISIAYDFQPIPDEYISNAYGFAGGNTYKGGWTGVTEFFHTKSIGNCVFTENNVTLTHQAARVDEIIVKQFINNKVTVVNIEGNENSGYVYQIDWFDDAYFRTLECENKKYSTKTLEDTISLAKKIDNR